LFSIFSYYFIFYCTTLVQRKIRQFPVMLCNLLMRRFSKTLYEPLSLGSSRLHSLTFCMGSSNL